MKHILLKIFVSLLAFSIYASMSAYSQISASSLESKAINIAKEIQTRQLVISQTTYEDLIEVNEDSERRLSLRRFQFMNAIDESVTLLELENIFGLYRHDAIQFGNNRDQEILNLFSVIVNNYTVNPSEDSILQTHIGIEKFLSSSDWFVKHRAKLLSLRFDDYLANPNVSLKVMNESLMLIPQEETNYSQEAKILSLSEAAYLHNFLRNLELAVENSKLLIETSSSSNYPIDGYSVINNFIHSFSAWRDFETTKFLAETLLKLEQFQDLGSPGLTQMRLASVHNELGNYEEALDYASFAIANSNYEPIRQGAHLDLIIALAGLGNKAQVDSEIKKLIQTLDAQEILETERHISHAQALIHLNEGKLSQARDYFNQRLNLEIKYHLTKSNSETTQLIAELQNTADRRAEREEALETQAALKAEALKQEQTKNLLLIILLGMLALASVAITSQLRFRAKVARQLADAAEAALVAEQAKTDFLAVASHELRTPLNGIIGLSDDLTRNAPTAASRDKNAVVLQCGHDLLMTVENMLDMSLINGDSLRIYPEIMSLQKVVRKLENKWRPVIEKKNIAFTVHLDDSIPDHLFLDAKRIRQCIEILIANSAKFTSRGRIHVHLTGSTEDTSSTLHALKFVIADTGIGMEPDMIETMFQPFVQADSSMTREYGGNGLGLALANFLVQSMDGSIKMNSRAGRGTEVTITLPARSPQMMAETTPAALTDTPAQAVKATPMLDGRNVLIIEDDIASQNVLKTFLEPEGCTITCLPNGTDAIATLEQKHFDLILMDIRMPEVNGIQTTKNIRQSGLSFHQIPIIAVTADVSPETNARSMVAGVDVFLSKPINARALFDAIRFVLALDNEKPQVKREA